MRPVTKDDPPNYAFYTPASEDNETATFKTNGAVAVVYNSANVGASTGPRVNESMSWILTEVLNVTINDYDFPNPKKKFKAKAITDMKKALTRRYRLAHPDLVTMLGNFCSFCELPLPNSYLNVEHRAAKSPYPTYFLWWWNFLLACTSCNSTKLDNPSRVTTTGWSAAMNPTEQELVAEIESHYFWPDLDAETFRKFRFEFFCNTNTVKPVKLLVDEYRSRQNTLVSQTMDTVNADVFENGVMRNNVRVECRIWVNGPGPESNRTTALTGLDRHENERSMYRTVAWLACCMQLQRLFLAVWLVDDGKKDAMFAQQWASVLEMARLRGFYSTWLDILEETGFPRGVTKGGYVKLGAKFAFDTNPANNPLAPLQTVPGTNYAQVP